VSGEHTVDEQSIARIVEAVVRRLQRGEVL
jgi:hypothetical protein